jgi:hypothetical protein
MYMLRLPLLWMIYRCGGVPHYPPLAGGGRGKAAPPAPLLIILQPAELLASFLPR